jgi:hypothetical protein
MPVYRCLERMMDEVLRYRRLFWQYAAFVMLAFCLTYLFVVRPYHLSWGATDQDAALVLPGDRGIPAGAGVTTRAITINAPAAIVWAWLVQTGQNRGGGWHSYEWLENLFAADMRQTEQIDPALQQLELGDTLFFHAAGTTNAAFTTVVTDLQPERMLVLGGGWSFVLQPLDPVTTRLIVRYPLRPNEFGNPVLTYGIFEPAHFVMESGMMLGIKQRAERDFLLDAPGAR